MRLYPRIGVLSPIYASGHLSKRGSPLFNAYYQKKRSEGKHHLVATNAVARKLCHTIYAVLKNSTPYEIKQ